METVIKAIRTHGPLTDDRICELTGAAGGAVRPARLRLYRRGLIEPTSSGAWQAVSPERRAEVRSNAAAKPVRRRNLAQWTEQERMDALLELLNDDDLNRQLVDRVNQDRIWRRARARSAEIRSERERARRERRAEAVRAAQEASALADFLKTRNHLKDSVEVLIGLWRLFTEDAARHDAGEPVRVPAGAWPEVARNVSELLRVAAALHLVLGTENSAGPTCPTCDGSGILTHSTLAVVPDIPYADVEVRASVHALPTNRTVQSVQRLAAGEPR